MQPSLKGHILILVIFAVQKVPCEYKQPFGINMCRQYCKRYFGCGSYAFYPSTLLCRIPENGEIHLDGIIYNITKINRFSAGKGRCTNDSIIIQRKRKSKTCVNMKPRTKDDHTILNRLWFTAMKTPSSKRILFQLFLPNEKNLYYKINIKAKMVSAIAYNTPKESLLIATVGPDKVLRYSLRRDEAVTIVQGEAVNSMTLEEEEQHLFLAITKPSSIGKLKLGRSLMRIYEHQEIYGVTICSKSRRVFTVEMLQVISLDYDGNDKTTYLSVNTNTPLAINHVENCLYYVNRSRLVKIHLSEGAENVIRDAPCENVANLAVDGNKAYVSCYEKKIFIYDPMTPPKIKSYDIVRGIGNGRVMCLV